ncbi:MAG TPA: class I SAM-dependent methyltransferase [Candidatus Margulisiibacteriota bacterium]|nr:class I SAM-dependent methyltransferase [Candidatus Margulisiibacteriota bacterium]
MSIEQNLEDQIRGFDRKESEYPTQKSLQSNKDLGLLFSPRNIIQGMRLLMPDIFRLNRRQEISILEVGCGCAADTIILLRMAGFSASMGIDLSSNRVESGRKIAASFNIDPECIQKKSIQDFIAQGGSFDLVIGQCILHHFVKYGSFLESISSILKPGGRFIFYEPAIHPFRFFSFHYDFRKGEFIQNSPCEEIFVNPFKIKKAVARAGFKNCRVFSNFYNYRLTAAFKDVPLLKYAGPSVYIYGEKN